MSLVLVAQVVGLKGCVSTLQVAGMEESALCMEVRACRHSPQAPRPPGSMSDVAAKAAEEGSTSMWAWQVPLWSQ